MSETTSTARAASNANWTRRLRGLQGAFVPIAAVLLALVIGAICVRLREIYFSFITLAFQMFIHSIILTWVSLTGGDQGLRGGIPRPAFWGRRLSRTRIG